MKNLITFFILFSSLSTYVFFLFTRNYPLSIISIALGFIIWLISMGIYKRKISGLHFILILFGMLVSLAFFIGYGIEQDMWGGYHFDSEASFLSFGLMLILILPGVYLFYKNNNEPLIITPPERKIELTNQTSIDQSNNESQSLSEFENPMMEYDPELINSYYQYYYGNNDE